MLVYALRRNLRMYEEGGKAVKGMCANVRQVQGKLMELPNANWQQIMDRVGASPDVLQQTEIQQMLHNLLQSNVSVCQSMGGYFLPQMVRIYNPMLHVYAKYSELINKGIHQAGALGAQHSAIKSMRSVKKTTLRLIETFVDTIELKAHLAVIASEFVPSLMEPILSDYEHCLADAKCDSLTSSVRENLPA
jgi:exportin-1